MHRGISLHLLINVITLSAVCAKGLCDRHFKLSLHEILLRLDRQHVQCRTPATAVQFAHAVHTLYVQNTLPAAQQAA